MGRTATRRVQAGLVGGSGELVGFCEMLCRDVEAHRREARGGPAPARGSLAVVKVAAVLCMYCGRVDVGCGIVGQEEGWCGRELTRMRRWVR